MPQDTLTLAIDGMTCASCVARVERVLARQPGVLAATVQLTDATARLRLVPGTQVLPLTKALEAIGYPARPLTDEDRAADHAADHAGKAARRALLAAALTLPVFVSEMGGHLVPAFHHWQHMTFGLTAVWSFQAILTALVLALPGRDFFTRGLPALLRGQPEMNALVALGTGAAFLFSLATLAGLTPQPAVYFEAAAVIVTLILTGRWLEARAKGRAGEAVRALLALAPATVTVERDGQPQDAPLAGIRAGDILHLRPGERVAVDGTVLSGTTHLDESAMTGESLPVSKADGDPVKAGTLNLEGHLRYRATRVGAETDLARIVATVEAAQAAKLPVQDLVNRVAAVFVPAVLAVAALTLGIWLALGQPLALGLTAAVSVLVVACPCAMGLAVPTSVVVAMGRAARMGVVFREAQALQRLATVATVAFDKTGTLTEGRMAVTATVPAAGVEPDTLLRLAAAVEAGSEHPLARAIRAAAPGPLPQAEGFAAEAGFGVSARIEGQRVLAGAARLMQREGIDAAPLARASTEAAGRGATPVFVAADGRLLGLVAVSDRLRPGAAAAVRTLAAKGVTVAMITGDTGPTARAIAAEAGIAAVEAEVLPAQKAAALARLPQPAAFVGDGINDAAALASAEVGIAMGTGTDVAIESAGIVLLNPDPRGVAGALMLSRATMANIRENLVFAFGYNVLLIPVAAGALVPFGGPSLSPMLAAAAMAASSLCVLGNALRLARFQPPWGTR